MTRFSTKSPILKLTMMIVVTAITAQLTTLPLGAATFQGTVLQTTEVVIPDGPNLR